VGYLDVHCPPAGNSLQVLGAHNRSPFPDRPPAFLMPLSVVWPMRPGSRRQPRRPCSWLPVSKMLLFSIAPLSRLTPYITGIANLYLAVWIWWMKVSWPCPLLPGWWKPAQAISGAKKPSHVGTSKKPGKWDFAIVCVLEQLRRRMWPWVYRRLPSNNYLAVWVATFRNVVVKEDRHRVLYLPGIFYEFPWEWFLFRCSLL